MHIHLVGVGGVAMGNLAAMLQAGGHTVSGSDHALYPPMSDKLREWGIDAHPFDAANLQRKHPDLCIIGNAISRGNVEVEYILNERLPYTSMAAALFDFFLKDKQVIVIAGTHGKTTTTFLMDHVLSEADRPPGLFAGGVRADGMNGFRVSDSQYFVIEGDEYDTAFFDKAAKFLHYRPKYLILTSVEFDHADIYENKRAYQKSFQHLLRLVPGKGSVIAAAEDRGVRQVLRDYHLAPIHWYASERFTRKKASALREIGIKSPYVQKENRGVSNDSPVALSAFSRKARTVQFDWPGTIEDFALLGEHNTANAQAVSILAAKLGLDPERVRGALQNFPGVLRRQQVRLDLPAESTAAADAGITFIEDFAHHPTAVRATIKAVRDAYPGRTIHALFEPRSATSHRKLFQKTYVNAFRGADRVYICDVFNPDKVSRKERLDVRRLVNEINRSRKKKTRAYFAGTPDELLTRFRKQFQPHEDGDVVLAMSNGAFGGIYPDLEQILQSCRS